MRVFCPVIFVFVMACGSGGSGNEPDPIDPIDPGGGITDPSALPTTGRATYQGQLTLDLGAAPMSSALDLSVDFGATEAQVTGSAGAFAGTEGTLFLTLGQIDREPAPGVPTVAGTVSGTLRSGGEGQTVFGQFAADFRGSGQEALRGTLTGNVIRRAVQSDMSGSFQAARLP